MNVADVLRRMEGKLLVSCQAPDEDPFAQPESLARFARTAEMGGAAGIRANGMADVRAIRDVVKLPLIAIDKQVWSDGRILITGSLERARELLRTTGAEMIAVDVTARGQRFGALDRVRALKQDGAIVLADIARVEEAVAAVEAGADAVLSTMHGYTDETAHTTGFDPGLIAVLRQAVPVPVIAEGRIHRPEQAAAAMQAGAWAVIVGTAITRPEVITRGFVEAVERAGRGSAGDVLGIDMGGTNTKYGVVTADGALRGQGFVPTPGGGGAALLAHLKKVALELTAQARGDGFRPATLGVATAGWVDPHTGRVAYATENLPGWTGTRIAEELQGATGLPVYVENDANALAAAESRFGAARDVRDFVCITLGTGVGGGCYTNGRLNHGAHFFANALGHIPIVMDGLPCTCGLRGCLEVYANASALVRYAGDGFGDAEQVIAAARGGDAKAREAVLTLARYLAFGTASIVQLLDPELLVLAGGVVQENELLLEALRAELRARLTVPEQRALRVETSGLGYYAGVYGAAAVALERG
ncbi:MAG: putative N-acetylmannosamine-6-phosphate 2-epimerase [Bryobacterales bacterium]|nr:putative N-acetylmannosamine-6-phosphate 2-epimerase [Bryobacterales bacterium]